MKKLFLISTFVLSLSILSACSQSAPNGTYKDANGNQISFKDSSHLTMKSPKTENVTADGTYKISDGKISMTLSADGITQKMPTSSFSTDSNSVTIDGDKFTK